MVRTQAFLGMAVAMLLLGSACNKTDAPERAAGNLAAVKRSADDHVAAAVRAEQKDLSIDAYEVAVARADGDHKIAIQKCDALEGREQKACKDQADADYDVAKADAKAIRAAQVP